MRSDLRQFPTTGAGEDQTMNDRESRNVSTWRRFWRATTGNALTEFALSLPIFLYMVCGITDMARLLYQQTTLQNAVRAGGRFAATGNHLPNPTNPNQNLSRVASIDSVAQQAALGLSVANLTVSSVAGGSGSAGGPLDTVTVSLTSNVKLLTPMMSAFFPGGKYNFTVSATYQNEPFPPSQTT
jgi:Flp pilus assembly protein TadG